MLRRATSMLAVVGALVGVCGCKRELADAPAPRHDERFSARVLRVSDGDSLSVERGGKRLRVRLFGVDAPERSQRFGAEATKFLRERIEDKTIDVHVRAVDRYGRAVAIVRLHGAKATINHALVAAGWAWWYRRFAPTDEALRTAQAQARKKKLGLWAAKTRPIAPWHFRRARGYRRRRRRRRRRAH